VASPARVQPGPQGDPGSLFPPVPLAHAEVEEAPQW
jgi:hypothetical protein